MWQEAQARGLVRWSLLSGDEHVHSRQNMEDPFLSPPQLYRVYKTLVR